MVRFSSRKFMQHYGEDGLADDEREINQRAESQTKAAAPATIRYQANGAKP